MTTGASPNNLRQLGVHQELMNILHLIISDGLMGRHKQHSLLLYNLKLSIGLERMPIYIPFHWLVVGTSPALLAHTIAKRRRLEVWKGEAKKDQEEGWRNSFGVSLLPYPGSVYLIKDVSAWLNWAVTCLLLFLLQWGLRKRNKHTWQYLPCNPAVSYLENAL